MRKLTLLALISIGLVLPGSAQTPPLLGNLKPGPYAVGFRSVWELDYSRTYRTRFKDGSSYGQNKAPRPIQINVWYPAQAKSTPPQFMRFGEYASSIDNNPAFSKLAKALIEYTRTSFIGGLGFEAKEDSLRPQEKSLFQAAMNTPIPAIKNAAVASGKFPLVLYHPGLAGTVDENTSFLEYLASHGYVVISSSYQSASGDSYSVDYDLDRSADDFDYLLKYATQLPNIDWNRIAVAGYSFGAQAAIAYGGKAHVPINVILSFDSTVDEASPESKAFAQLYKRILDNKNLSMPILLFAQPRATFQVMDSIKTADRYYITVSNMTHDDLFSAGLLIKQVQNENGEKKAVLARIGYESICEIALDFLNNHLKTTISNPIYVYKTPTANQTGQITINLEKAEKGVSAPVPYNKTSQSAPSMRQFIHFYKEQGPDEAIKLIRRFAKDTLPSGTLKHAFINRSQLEDLTQDLVFAGHQDEAMKFVAAITELNPSRGKVFSEWTQEVISSLKNRYQVPAETLHHYVGKYADPQTVTFVETQGNQLFVKFGSQKFELLPFSKHYFGIDGGIKVRFQFIESSNGNISELKMKFMNGPTFSSKRVE